MLSKSVREANATIGYYARTATFNSSREKFIAVFEAYLDESGIHDGSRVCALAGYLAPAKEWKRFVPKWQPILDAKGIHVFHATKCNGFKGEFARFEGKKDERDKLVAELCETISSRRRIVPFLAGIIVEEYSDDFRKAIGMDAKHPYYMGMMSILTQFGLWMNLMKYPAAEKVKLIFDRQNEFSKHALALFQQATTSGNYWEGQERFRGITFESKEDFTPLQAADALAFDAYHEFRRRYYHPEKAVRPSFQILSKGVPGFVWDDKEIQKITDGKKALAQSV